MLVDGIDPIDRDSCFAARAPTDRDAGVARFCRVERSSFVDLDAGLEAGQFEIVASVQGQFVYLACAYDATDGGLL